LRTLLYVSIVIAVVGVLVGVVGIIRKPTSSVKPVA